jgi:hypothetical protein
VVLGTYLVATLIVVLVFAYLPKRLHLLELWFNAIVFIYLYTYLFSIFTNMNLVSLPIEPDKLAASVTVRFVMFPLLILLFLEICVRSTLRTGFIVLILSGVVLVFAQQIFRWTGIIQYTEAGNYGSSFAWFAMLGMNAWCMSVFRRMIRKELKPS